MRILIDAMGGDNAPDEIVKGGVMAAQEYDVEIGLIGPEETVRASLRKCGGENEKRISVINATEVITMEDDPSTAARRKKDSSMTVGLRMVSTGEGDAFISAGSTGALLSGATLITKRIRGIRRACFGPVLPNGGKGVLLIDCGANVECTPEYLLQFAFMGSFYAGEILHCEEPRVGLLNIGVEETKGTELQKEAYKLLSRQKAEGRLNFIGNIEAREALSGNVDVIVTDGFSGNILLKGIEGTASMLMKQIKGIFYKSTANKLAAAVVQKDMRSLKAMFDVSEAGGTALLGISRPVIKAHGSSDARAIRSSVRQAIAFMSADVIGSIEKNIDYMRITAEGE